MLQTSVYILIFLLLFGSEITYLKSLELWSICSAFHKLNNTLADPETYLIQFETQLFLKRDLLHREYIECVKVKQFHYRPGVAQRVPGS